MILIWCAFKEVHWITIDGTNGDFGDNFWDMGTVGSNVSYGLTNLEGGYIIERGVLSYLSVLVVKHTSDEGNTVVFMFILSVIQTSNEDVEVREPPRVGGGTVSVI